MSNSGRKPLSPAEANKLGEERESWCAVELKKEQSWCRKERQHHDEILKSTVFDVHRPVYEPRCTFQINAPTHRERRHFDQQCKVHLSNALCVVPKYLSHGHLTL